MIQELFSSIILDIINIEKIERKEKISEIKQNKISLEIVKLKLQLVRKFTKCLQIKNICYV